MGDRTLWPDTELKAVSDRFEEKEPREVLAWALNQFGAKIALACSFGAEDVALIDMVAKIDPKARVFYLDTELLFAETYDVIARIRDRYPELTLLRYRAHLSPEDQGSVYGQELWQSDADRCCNLRKVVPLKEALSPLEAWITGIRRDQAPARAHAAKVEWDQKFTLVKVNPLAAWTWEDVWNYIRANNVPYNVLHDQSYPSIGCQPCTRQVKPGEDPRAGRWAGKEKTECGLHQ